MTLDLISKEKKSRPVKYAHFKSRFYERAGWIISDDGCEKLLEKIRKEGKLVKSSYDNKSVFRVEWEGISMRIVVSIMPMSLITILEPNPKYEAPST